MNEDMVKKLGNMLQTGELPNDLRDMISNYSSSKNTENSNTPKGSGNNSSNFQNMDFNSIFESIKNSSNSEQASSSSDDKNASDNSNPFANIDMATIIKLKTIIDKMNAKKDDPRSNLLLSLKPYLKPSRKEKVDQYVKIFSMTQIFDSLNFNGGENKK